MPTVAERVGIVETQVANLDEKIDELKVDVKEMHDCLDQTRDGLTVKLDQMYSASCTQHAELATKINELEKSKNKMMMYGMVSMAFVAGLGWTGQLNIQTILKFFGV
jgi:outer membrane murein-binding lipoprotein Lpp